jgi:hypothetical protein
MMRFSGDLTCAKLSNLLLAHLLNLRSITEQFWGVGVLQPCVYQCYDSHRQKREKMGHRMGNFAARHDSLSLNMNRTAMRRRQIFADCENADSLYSMCGVVADIEGCMARQNADRGSLPGICTSTRRAQVA